MNITYDDLFAGLKVLVKHRRRNLSEEGVIEGTQDGTLQLRVKYPVTKDKMTFEVEKIIVLDAFSYDFLAFDNPGLARIIKRREVNTCRELYEAAGVDTKFGLFDSDIQSISRFNLLTEAKEWKTRDNKTVSLTLVKRTKISDAFALHYSKAFKIAQTLKRELDTIVDPENYDVAAAWDKESSKP